MSFFSDAGIAVDLDSNWRSPQRGAIGALLAHFSLGDAEPPLVSIPTGTGKTALALVAPFLAKPRPRRVLLVEPSIELRGQVAREATTFQVLKRIGTVALDAPLPKVLEVAGRIHDWNLLREADFVVAHPNSISPAHYEANLPPPDLFDMIVVDEAHHVPAPTWHQILEYFQPVHVLLLTATPFRRDGRRIPAHIAYHYPMKNALAEGLYQRVEPILLDVAPGATREELDTEVASIAHGILQRPEHETSSLLIRGSSKQRAEQLAAMYSELGVPTEVLHSGLGQTRRTRIVERLRTGEARAVAVVGMLAEGFDLPRLRIAAYHDKHRSTPATIQLIGRLARVDPEFPQGSVLIVARDADVFPELQGTVRSLYEEDADWVRVLPGLIDEEVARIVADQQYVDDFESAGTFAPALLTPLNRSSIFEVTEDWRPTFRPSLPSALQVGERLHGATILYAGVSPDGDTLVVGTRHTEQPRWTEDPTLTNVTYGLTLLTYRPAPQVGMPSLVLENSDDPSALSTIHNLLELDAHSRLVDPEIVSQYLDSVERTSISSVGLRGETSYRNILGRNVGRALRTSDTARAGLGHVMMQTQGQHGHPFTVGGATAKGKIWSTRYSSLREYNDWIDEVTGRIWFPRVGTSGPVLPNVSRGSRLVAWPDSIVVAVDFAPELYARDVRFHGPDGTLLAGLDDVLLAQALDELHGGEALTLTAMLAGGEDEEPFWVGRVNVSGEVETTRGHELAVMHGYSPLGSMATFLTHYPPSIHFLNGQRVEGHVVYDERGPNIRFSPALLTAKAWDGTDITVETKRKAAQLNNGRISIHEAMEQMFRERFAATRRRHWVMCNDGQGEIADYLVIEDLGRGQVAVELWHAKAAGGQQPALRIKDLQVVFGQAMRSRRGIQSTRLWSKIHRRLSGLETPAMVMVAGSSPEQALRARLGFDNPRWPSGWIRSWRRIQPKVEARIGIVQPGLSRGHLLDPAHEGDEFNSASDISSLLTVLEDFATAEGWGTEVICSP